MEPPQTARKHVEVAGHLDVEEEPKPLGVVHYDLPLGQLGDVVVHRPRLPVDERPDISAVAAPVVGQE